MGENNVCDVIQLHTVAIFVLTSFCFLDVLLHIIYNIMQRNRIHASPLVTKLPILAQGPNVFITQERSSRLKSRVNSFCNLRMMPTQTLGR
jgi:hypothetical protein